MGRIVDRLEICSMSEREGYQQETQEEMLEEEDEMINFMSGLEGYLDQIETEASEQRRAKKLKERLCIHTVSSDDDEATTDEDNSDDWEDCSDDSDDSELNINFNFTFNIGVNPRCDSNSSDCTEEDSEFKEIMKAYAESQMYDSDDFGVDEDGRTFYVKNGYRMYSDGEYEYEYDRAVYWD